ncbi:hypothetical protein [Actinocrispum sp. NPDC049592]|uniref:hypothetical protein n=1 Tax=Actinocrispum sp. NPDC049592 TaxID=3154835 RepID=UPI00341A6B90
MTDEWRTELGAEVTRTQLKALYGGSGQRGIELPTATPNILVFTDPSAGEQHGYRYDGWDPDGSVYYYTGEGQQGDQTLTSGNKAILNHEGNGKALRLFKATGRELNPGGKVHAYLGEFVVDAELPFYRAPAPGTGGGPMRQVLVFRLKPKAEVVRVSGDGAPLRKIQLVPTSSNIPLEQSNTDEYEVSAREANTAKRREADLVRRYEACLKSQEHVVGRLRLRFGSTSLYTDLFDHTANELYEAKGSVSRVMLRLAVGQLLDYRRYLGEATPRLTVLLPERPSDDSLDYLASVDMDCVYATGEYTFERHSA